MLSLTATSRWALCAAIFGGASPALGQGAPRVMAREDGGGAGYRSVLVALPVASMSHEAVGHFEVNLAAKAALAVEAMLSGPHQEMDGKEQQATGESMVAQTKGLALLLCRYTEPGRMMGFYWGLGLGYRQEQVKWRAQPDANDPGQKQLTLTDHGQTLNHDLMMAGPTGHIRGGYRYVGSDWPLEIGAYLGLRHFQPAVKDLAKNDHGPGDDGVSYQASSDRERQRLTRRFETEPEVGVEVGFVF